MELFFLTKLNLMNRINKIYNINLHKKQQVNNPKRNPKDTNNMLIIKKILS